MKKETSGKKQDKNGKRKKSQRYFSDF